jgi:8-amino-7-oxononanoate synthase
MLLDPIRHELESLERHGLLRRLRRVDGASMPELALDGRPVLQFSSNNYLGLATHPRVTEAAARAARELGAGSGASRLISGNFSLHERLEGALAAFKGTGSALVYATGSMANLGLLSALAGRGDRIYLDALGHATLYDGARLSGAEVLAFPHNDVAALSALLDADAGLRGRKLVAVDGVFSMDGDLAPLPELDALCSRHGAFLVVDEAHASGVLGPQGRGSLEHFGLKAHEGLIQVGTLSKAFGSLGGFVACEEPLRRYLITRSRSFVYATALPPSCAAAALEALAVMEQEPGRRERLWALRGRLARGLHRLGFDTFGSQTPILPVRMGRVEAALACQERLWEQGIFCPAIRPPTVPKDASRLRLSLTADHTEAQVDRLLAALGGSHAGEP